jgi:NADH-quinone oxidoreductase subunit J
VLSFFGSAMLFYLLGAPFLAALEIIIYAGAIMVLFLFIIMMIRVQKAAGMFFPKRQLIPALAISIGFLAVCGLLMASEPTGRQTLTVARVLPEQFGRYLFQTHWLAIEIASLLLLAALIGAYLLGRRVRQTPGAQKETP